MYPTNIDKKINNKFPSEEVLFTFVNQYVLKVRLYKINT